MRADGNEYPIIGRYGRYRVRIELLLEDGKRATDAMMEEFGEIDAKLHGFLKTLKTTVKERADA